MYWDPQACHWDMLGSIASAVGYAGIHNPSAGCYWVPNFCTRTYWDPGLLHWSLLWGHCAILGVLTSMALTLGHPTASALGHTGMHGLYTGAFQGPSL